MYQEKGLLESMDLLPYVAVIPSGPLQGEGLGHSGTCQLLEEHNPWGQSRLADQSSWTSELEVPMRQKAYTCMYFQNSSESIVMKFLLGEYFLSLNIYPARMHKG